MTHPIDTPSIAGGWVYYLLGASNEQLAVYHGQQDTGNVCGDTSAGVSMYPTEYLTHGIGYTGVGEDISQVITDASGNKQYRISDHLATLRATVGGSGISSYDSDPWGGTLEVPVTGESRRVFNDREKDRETGNLNLGVRSEEPSLGRFTSIDPLWEKFPSQSPYVYADNNPLRMTDPTGMQAFPRAYTYPGTVEWLIANGGGGGGGAAPLIAIGAGITYVTQHPEQTVPFLTDVADNTVYAFSNPIGFSTSMMEAAWENVFGATASGAESLPDLTGKKRAEADKALEDAGFINGPPTAGGYAKWYHPDGSRVFIDPDGKVDRVGPKVTPSGADGRTKKYRPRIGPNGKRLGPEDSHDTGENVTND